MATMGFIKSDKKTEPKISKIIVPETFTHSIAFGQTGCGKTTSYIYANLENRIRLGHGILLYDYKGKEHLSVKFIANKLKRLDDVVEIAKPWGKSINLVENMTEDELDIFFKDNIGSNNNNEFWQNSAITLGQSIFKVLKAINNFSKSMTLIDSNYMSSFKYIKTQYSKFPKFRTLETFVEVCQTYTQLSNFISELDELVSATQSIVVYQIAQLLKMDSITTAKIKQHKSICKDIVSSWENLRDTVEETSSTLNNFGVNGNERMIEQYISTLISPLFRLSQNSHFNTNELDIISSLNDGKIVIVNTESLSASTMESLNNVLMYELSKRTKDINAKPISIFIDEAHKVLSESIDLPIDIFREARVDVFLATQNTALLKNKLTNDKYESLMGNLTQKFYFKNSMESNSLKSFEYVCEYDNYDSIYRSNPVFISTPQKLRVEYTYQKRLKVLDKYLYTHINRFVILEYIPRLFNENNVVAIDIKSMKEEVVQLISRDKDEDLEHSVNAWFDQAQSIKRFEEYDENMMCQFMI